MPKDVNTFVATSKIKHTIYFSTAARRASSVALTISHYGAIFAHHSMLLGQHTPVSFNAVCAYNCLNAGASVCLVDAQIAFF